MREQFDAAGRFATPADGTSYKPYVPKPATPLVAPATAAGGAMPLPPVPGGSLPGAAAAAAAAAVRPHSTQSPMRPASSLQGTEPGQVQSGIQAGNVRSSLARSVTTGSPGKAVVADLQAMAAAQQQQQQQQQVSKPSTPAAAVPNTVVDFPTFVALFMREPPRALRFMHGSVSAPGAAPVNKQATGVRRAGRR